MRLRALLTISVLASVTNQELVSYAWIFPNVVTNGHWWYSNTPTYIEHDARARLEAAALFTDQPGCGDGGENGDTPFALRLVDQDDAESLHEQQRKCDRQHQLACQAARPRQLHGAGRLMRRTSAASI